MDLAFLAMTHAGLGQPREAAAALAELDGLLAAQPALSAPRIDQFHAEARAAVAALPAAPPPDDK